MLYATIEGRSLATEDAHAIAAARMAWTPVTVPTDYYGEQGRYYGDWLWKTSRIKDEKGTPQRPSPALRPRGLQPEGQRTVVLSHIFAASEPNAGIGTNKHHLRPMNIGSIHGVKG